VADIVLIAPRFEVSMYGLEYALPFLRAKAVSPPASLPLLAALTPPQHRVTLIDENVEPIDFARCARADIVGVTGLLVQRTRMKEIVADLKRRGAFVVLGGPLVTSGEDYFAGIADVTFIGEAEETWPRFLAEWQDGRHQIRYEQSEKTDLSRVPVPRYELLKMRRYAFGTVQFSRGCPFTCEFCDIIVHFGRRPRFKTRPQVIAELDALRAHGVQNKEGRLDLAEEPLYGTNVISLKMSREELQLGSFALSRDLYEASAYFDRLDALYLDGGLQAEQALKQNLERHALRKLWANTIFLIQAGAIFASLLRQAPEELGRVYRARMWNAIKRRCDPIVLRIYALKCAVHYHMHIMLRRRGENPYWGRNAPAPVAMPQRQDPVPVNA
jgi:hypothetical protein